MNGPLKKIVFCILIAFALWTLMFSPWTAHLFNFWLGMTVAALVLTTLVCCFARDTWRLVRLNVSDVLLGVSIAVVLWCVFWLGDVVSSWILPFAREQVSSIYGLKMGESPWVVSALLLFVIGPAEELFWRGYVQRKLSARWNPNRGFLVATLLYTLVHITSFNFMLIMSALVCGLAWGGLFRLIPHRFGAILLSHALWDAAVFIWFPIS